MDKTRERCRGYSFMGCLLAILLLITISLFLLIAVETNKLSRREESLPPAPPPVALQVHEQTVTREELSRLFESEIVPLIDNTYKDNIAAKDRALQSLREDFDGFRRGVPEFVEGLTSWTTRAGVVTNLTRDKWNAWWNDQKNADQLGAYINSKFKEQVLSEDDLRKAFETSIEQFTTDLAANRNALLSEVTLVLSSTKMPVTLTLSEDDLGAFSERFEKYYSGQVQTLSLESVKNGVFATIAGELATLIAIHAYSTVGQVSAPIITTVMTPITAGLAAQVAATGLVAGGTTASFAAVGAAGGTTAGPLGTGVGLVIGIVVGGVVDWWISDKFKQEATEDIIAMLSLMEEQIISGVSKEGETSPGLESIYTEANLQMKRVIRHAMLEALYERGSS